MVHVFPLPYHQMSFLANEGAWVLGELSGGGDDKALCWMNSCWKNQESWGNGATANMSFTDVVGLMGKAAESECGYKADEFKNAIESGAVNEDTRVSWKFGCARGVAGTPTFFLNGVELGPDAGGYTASQWVALLKQYL